MLVRDQAYNLMAFPIWPSGLLGNSPFGRLLVQNTLAEVGTIFEAEDNGHVFVWKIMSVNPSGGLAACARMAWSDDPHKQNA